MCQDLGKTKLAEEQFERIISLYPGQNIQSKFDKRTTVHLIGG